MRLLSFQSLVLIALSLSASLIIWISLQGSFNNDLLSNQSTGIQQQSISISEKVKQEVKATFSNPIGKETTDDISLVETSQDNSIKFPKQILNDFIDIKGKNKNVEIPTNKSELNIIGNDKPKIAFVFAGSARSFICPKVHWSLKSHLIDALNGDPYVFIRIATEDNKNTKTGLGMCCRISEIRSSFT